MYRFSYGTKNLYAHKSSIKDIHINNNHQKELLINGFNIIELNEEEVNKDTELNNIFFSEREIQRLKKKAVDVEEHYSNNSVDEKINENCFNCLMSNFKPNELLYFSKRNDLLTYLKYCFYFLKNNLFIDNQIYIENRYDLDKCDINYLNGWRFFIPKTVCRGCFLQIINMEHLFGNIKAIFTDMDPHSTSTNFNRKRRRFFSRSRKTLSTFSNNNNINKNNNINENKIKEKNKISSNKENNKNSNKIKIRNPNYKSKNKPKFSFNNRNKLKDLKKKIVNEENALIKKEENEKISKNHKKKISEYKEELNNECDEQSVREIKIKINDFLEQGILSEDEKIDKKNNNYKKNKKPKNNEFIKKDDNKLINNTTINNVENNTKDIANNSKNDIIIPQFSGNNYNYNELTEEKENNNLYKKSKTMRIYNEIMNIKYMTNKTVMSLNYRLSAFKDILLYIIINVGDFKEKLYNSLHFNPQIISMGIIQYEYYFSILYNEGFKAKKEYEEIISKIKKESIPSITKNISKLREIENTDDGNSENLDKMEKKLNDFLEKVNNMEQKYEEDINNFFINFCYFFQLIKELKDAFGGKMN